MKKSTRQLLTFGLIVATVLSAIAIMSAKAPLLGKKYIKIKDAVVFIEVADTSEKKAKGLGERDSLGENAGMLFVFDEPRPWPFWMKGMRFPLDFIWIRDNKVVDISKNVPTQTDENPVYVTPKEDITSVLEVNAGWTDKNNIQIGDRVEIYD